jgi:hypothetical protein
MLMKARFFAIAAMVLGLASCQRDFAPEANLGGEVDFRLEVSAPELGATRADADAYAGHDSAYGAIDYLSDEEWSKVDLRYTFEVYDEAADYTNAAPIKDRQVIIVDKYQPVTFETRLIPQYGYHFVVFADFVPQGATNEPTAAAQQDLGLRHVIGANLGDITIKADAINDEYADAYFATLDYTPTHNTHNTSEPIVLKRPYGKVRVVATDLAELNLNVEPRAVRVAYNAYHANAFNAVNGNIAGEYVQEFYDFEYADLYKNVEPVGLSQHVYTEGYDARTAVSKTGVERHTHVTLFTDYILAENEQNTINFLMTVYNTRDIENATAENIIKATAFDTEIPVQRNRLTTIIGNVLTTATDIHVSIDDNFESDINGNSQERILLETLINGGIYDLKSDLTITAPTWLKGDAVIRLNGYTLTYDIPTDKENDGKYAIMTRVENGSSLTFVGNGSVVSEGYIASVNEGGVVNINTGNYFTTSCTLFQSNGGEINITGGTFEAAEYDGDHRYTLNFIDSKKQEGLIEVTGGRFYKYNPSEGYSENPAMDFCGAGYWGVEDGDWYNVVPKKNIDLFVDHAEVYTAEGLLQWAYIVENGPISAFESLVGFDAATFNKKAYGLEIMTNIVMPANTIAPMGETYVFTDEDITFTNGVPSGSNWAPVCNAIAALEDGYTGWVDGCGKTISGLIVNTTSNYAGFIGFMFDGVFVKDLTFRDAYVKGAKYVGVVAGRAQDATTIENVRVVNSTVSGTGTVGGLVGYNYSRVGGAQGQGYAEGPAIVRNCVTDVNTKVVGTSTNIGGIVGNNYGATIINCHNYADVTGKSSVGGIVGYTRDYHHNKDGYIVACTTYPQASIVATNGTVGGIAGYTLADNQHTNTYMHIVACTSLSYVSGSTAGCIIGTINHGQHTAACVAVKNGATKLYGKGTPTTESNVEDAILYNAVGEATQADVDALNYAIDHYNETTPPTESECPYRWVLVDGFPVLQ